MKRSPMPPRTKPMKRSAPKRRKPVSPASAEQRAKVREAMSILSGEHGCDPAHITSKSGGYLGCDSALCVIPLTRQEHRDFDQGKRDILPALIAHGMVPEIQHALDHYNGDLIALIERLTGCRCVLEERS